MGRSPKHRSRSGRAARPEIRLFDDDPGSAEIHRERLQRTSGKRLRPLILVLLIVAIPALIVSAIASARSDGFPTESADPAGGVEDDESDPLVDTEPVERDELGDYGVDGVDIQPGNRFSAIDAALDDLVATASHQSRGERAILYGPVGELESRTVDPAALSQVTLDSSGNWVAGSYKNSFEQDVLLVGRTNVIHLAGAGVLWELEPMAVGINGFVWHPQTPGLLAYAENNLTQSTLVTVRDFRTERPGTLRFRADFPGRLVAGGDWGFGFRDPGPVPHTSVAVAVGEDSPTGVNQLETVITGVAGNPFGLIAPGRLLIDGGETATIVNLETGGSEPNEWFSPQEEVVAFRASPDGNYSVGLIVDRDRTASDGGRVVLFAADPDSVPNPAQQIVTARGMTTFDWSSTGRFVAGYQARTGPDSDGDAAPQRPSVAAVTVFDLERGLSAAREIRSPDGPFRTDLELSVDSLAFREDLPD